MARYCNSRTAILIVILLLPVVLHFLHIGTILLEWSKGTDDVPYRSQIDKENHNYRIPPIIHQIWKNEDISTYPITPSRDEWATKYQNYTVKLWTEEMIVKLVQSEYNWLWKLYSSYPYNIQRADVARYVILHYEGGTYVDLDGFPGDSHLDDIRNHQVVLLMTTDRLTPSNHFIMAEPRSEFFNYLLHELESHSKWLALPYLYVFWSTGPMFLGHIARQWLETHSDYDILLLPPDIQRGYCWHKAGRSWHTWDGKILNYLADDNGLITLFVYIGLMCSIFWLLFLLRRRNPFRGYFNRRNRVNR